MLASNLPAQSSDSSHLFGAMGNAKAVHEICERNGAILIHDCAQFLGDQTATSSLCRQGPCCFSLGESKILRVGEGGVIATNDWEFAEKVRLIRHEGELWLRQGQSRVTGGNQPARILLDGLATFGLGQITGSRHRCCAGTSEAAIAEWIPQEDEGERRAAS